MSDGSSTPNIDKLFSDVEDKRKKQLDEEGKEREKTHENYKAEIPDLVDKVTARLMNHEGGLLYPLRKSDKKLGYLGKNRFCWHLVSQGAPWRDVFLTLDNNAKGILVHRQDFMDDNAVAYDYTKETDKNFLKLLHDNLRVILTMKEEAFKPIPGNHTRYTWRK